MEVVRVDLGEEVDNSYDIQIDEGLFDNLAEELKNKPIANAYAIITDSNVERAYGNKILRKMKNNGINAHLISFSSSETISAFISQLLFIICFNILKS